MRMRTRTRFLANMHTRIVFPDTMDSMDTMDGMDWHWAASPVVISLMHLVIYAQLAAYIRFSTLIAFASFLSVSLSLADDYWP